MLYELFFYYSQELLKHLNLRSSNFENFLFDGVRKHALKFCMPSVLGAQDSFNDSNSIEDNDVSYEYILLQKTIFSVFECYIAGVDLKESESGDVLKKLQERLNVDAPSGQTICGHRFQLREPTYFCRLVKLCPFVMINCWLEVFT